MNIDAVNAQIRSVVLLHILAGNLMVCGLSRLGSMVAERFPEAFGGVADALLSLKDGRDPRAVAWDIYSILSEVPGAWNECIEARSLAAA